MLAISEKGRFIPFDKEDANKIFNGKKIEIILSSFHHLNFSDVNPNDDRFDDLDLLSGKKLFLPWWLHNRHMVILLKRDLREEGAKREQEKWKVQDSFYYESRMLSRKVNPVIITEPNDKKTLLLMFVNYWFRAKYYTNEFEKLAKAKSKGENKFNVSIPIINDLDELKDQMDELLELYDSTE